MQVVEVAIVNFNNKFKLFICLSQNSCHYFTFEHNQEYQKIQFNFLDAVETYDPNSYQLAVSNSPSHCVSYKKNNFFSLKAVLHTHPYHIDSLLQLSEVCKMGEDMQMAADLIGMRGRGCPQLFSFFPC